MSIRITVNTGNEGMRTREDVVDALRKIATRIQAGKHEGSILDVNGNTVGYWEITEPLEDTTDEEGDT